MKILASFSFAFVLSLCIFAQRDRSRLPREMQDKLTVTKADKIEFKAVLKESKGNLAKLWNNPCKYEKVVNVKDEHCFNDFDVRLASEFVFIWGEEFGYISLANREFSVKRYGLMHPILADLGETNINQISQNSNEVRILKSFPLTVDGQAKKIYPTTENPEYQGLQIKTEFPAKLNHTYLLRVTRIGGRVIGTLLGSAISVNQRRETIYAFQVVKEEDDVLTILWKKIESKIKPLK